MVKGLKNYLFMHFLSLLLRSEHLLSNCNFPFSLGLFVIHFKLSKSKKDTKFFISFMGTLDVLLVWTQPRRTFLLSSLVHWLLFIARQGSMVCPWALVGLSTPRDPPSLSSTLLHRNWLAPGF